MTSENKDQPMDFLEVDQSIPGQNYVCLSFVDPEEIIKNKEAFKTAKFLQSYSKDKGLKFQEVYEDYLNYQYKFQDELQNDFDKENKNITNIRGIKVRGVYSTKEEAEMRSKKLHQLDPTFHVFIGQVGYWLPFNPCADKIEDEKFLNDGLNELMEKYKENSISKDKLYEERKREKMEEHMKNKKLVENKIDSESEPVNLVSTIEPGNLVSTQKSEPDPEPEPESSIKLNDSQLDDSLKDSLNNVDPWLEKKLSSE